jgi:Ca2+-binding EF-hand superfamily protein
LKALHKYYDVDGDGNISYHEFVNALSDNRLCKRKTDMIEKAWMVLDKEQKGEIDAARVKACKKQGSSCSCFDGMNKVTFDDFLAHYREEAQQIPNDEYFIKSIESTWEGVVEDIDAEVKRDKVMHIIKLMRHRLTTISNSS